MRRRWCWRVRLLGMALGLLGVVGAAEAPRSILCSTYPIHLFTKAVAAGRAGVAVSLMLPATLGCPHDYVLTPQDMARLAQADVLVINGLGLEEFLGAPIKRVNPKIRIVDSSAGITDLLAGDGHGPCGEGCEHEHGHGHGVNPHLFASPRQAARLVMNIAEGLSAADPAGAETYRRNALTQAAALNRLADEIAAAGTRLRNHRIVQPHGVFDYLARDMGLEIVAVLQPHGQDPSAAEMLALAKAIRERQVGAIALEPQYPRATGQALAKETGVPLMTLDPVASGADDADPGHYERTMRENLATLQRVLGEK